MGYIYLIVICGLSKLTNCNKQYSKKIFEFDFYVVNLIDRLYVITNKEIKAYDISNELVHDFKLVALEYEKKNH